MELIFTPIKLRLNEPYTEVWTTWSNADALVKQSGKVISRCSMSITLTKKEGRVKGRAGTMMFLEVPDSFDINKHFDVNITFTDEYGNLNYRNYRNLVIIFTSEQEQNGLLKRDESYTFIGLPKTMIF